MILRGNGGLVPQSGNAAERPVECHQDNVTEHRGQDREARSVITAGPETHHEHHIQAVYISPSGLQKWVGILYCFDFDLWKRKRTCTFIFWSEKQAQTSMYCINQYIALQFVH
jgi:hypothetical protein